MAKKKIYTYVLSVDFEGGDGPDYFRIAKKHTARSEDHINRNFTSLLFASYPPPKVEVLGLTKAEWQRACKVGRERS